MLRGVLLAWIAGSWLGVGIPGIVLLAVLLVPPSVLLGRRSATEPWLRWAGIAASVAIAAVALLFTTAVRTQASDPQPYPATTVPFGGGVTNLHPYDRDGRPLTDVQLYDQDGNPVDLTGTTDLTGNELSRAARTTADGVVVTNVFPQQQSSAVHDTDGTVRQRTVVPPAVRPPKLSAG